MRVSTLILAAGAASATEIRFYGGDPYDFKNRCSSAYVVCSDIDARVRTIYISPFPTIHIPTLTPSADLLHSRQLQRHASRIPVHAGTRRRAGVSEKRHAACMHHHECNGRS